VVNAHSLRRFQHELVAGQAGREEIQKLASRYCRVSGKLKPPGTSYITYIVVYEREQGLMDG
jgi:hypothetical protein